MSEGPASKEALFRFLVISQVELLIARGRSQVCAIEEVASRLHHDLDGQVQQRTPRTLYRWLHAYHRDDLAGLEPASRARTRTSVVVRPELLRFFTAQKKDDPAASVPELIRRARELGIAWPGENVDRTTVWRAFARMGIDARRKKTPRTCATRRFEYPHRLDMILADGKHFRAGIHRSKRVALFFIDDHSRYGLHVVVGTTETAELFLRGLYELIRRYGFFCRLYLDNGPGFIAADTIQVVAKLPAQLIHGEAGYPEGHGKIERFNRTAKARVLRFDRRPDIDADLGALEVRLQHYLRDVYNHAQHESLAGQTPAERFEADTKRLRFPDNDRDLRRRFVVHFSRTVSNDNVISVENVDFEVPRGHAKQKILVHRRVLDGTLAILHDGRLINLHPVDLVANALTQRARTDREIKVDHALPHSAADLAFDRAYGPIVGPDGGFTDSEKS